MFSDLDFKLVSNLLVNGQRQERNYKLKIAKIFWFFTMNLFIGFQISQLVSRYGKTNREKYGVILVLGLEILATFHFVKVR